MIHSHGQSSEYCSLIKDYGSKYKMQRTVSLKVNDSIIYTKKIKFTKTSVYEALKQREKKINELQISSSYSEIRDSETHGIEHLNLADAGKYDSERPKTMVLKSQMIQEIVLYLTKIIFINSTT